MWDSPDTAHQRRWFGSPAWLALLVTLGLLGYLLADPQIRSIALAPLARWLPAGAVASAAPATEDTVVPDPGTEVPSRPAEASVDGVSATPTTGVPAQGAAMGSLLSAPLYPIDPAAPAIYDALEAQLRTMQTTLATLSQPLAIAIPLPAPAGSSAPAAPQPWTGGIADAAFTDIALTDAEVAAAVAEIERLYAIMRPLMIQLQDTSGPPRSNSEQTALRAQMTDLHAQLNVLIAQVQTAKGTLQTASGEPGTPVFSVAATAAPAVPLAAPANADLAQMQQLLAGLQESVLALQASGTGIEPVTPALAAVTAPVPAAIPASSSGDPALQQVESMLALAEGILQVLQDLPPDASGF